MARPSYERNAFPSVRHRTDGGRGGIYDTDSEDGIQDAMRVHARDLSAEADLFVAELYGEAPLVEVSGFFGPNEIRRTEQEIRNAVATRANSEWRAWHDDAGAPRPEGDPTMFGWLVGYALAAFSTLAPDTLTAVQAAAPRANYNRLLAATAGAATIAAESSRLAGVLLAGAAGGDAPGVATRVATAIGRARQAFANRGPYRAWSAMFVTACVRGSAIAQGLEAIVPPSRRHAGRDVLLLASVTHAAYTIEARLRRAAARPRRRGTYHAFSPRERPPRIADIIVQDRRERTSAQEIATLAGLAGGTDAHGDIVVELQRGCVVTVGGNVGDSCRRRRFPTDDQGLLVIDPRQLYTQEDDSGGLLQVPLPTAQPLADHSTARIFALLSPVEEYAAVPGQPYGGGVLT